MTNVFQPIISDYVDASSTHGKGAAYYVAIGNEVWDKSTFLSA